MTRLSAFGRTLRDPVALASAALVALVAAETPGDWIAHEIVRAAGLDLPALGTKSFLDLVAANDETALGWVVRAFLGWIVRLPLVAATLTTSSTLGFFGRNAGRAFRTRGTAIMAVSACAAIPVYALFALRKFSENSLLPDIGLAFVFALAGAWLALADRFALARFDARQDAIARQAIDDATNAPYYLNTGADRRGYGVASGTDNAVTSAGKAAFTGGALAVVATSSSSEPPAPFSPLRSPGSPARRASSPARSSRSSSR